MIAVTSNVAIAAEALRAIAEAMGHSIDLGIEAGLESLVQALESVTPVRTGHMKASWFIEQGGPGQWVFGDAAEYASYVAYGTRRMNRNERLFDTLQTGEAEIEAALDVAITHLTGTAA